ncbi:hypothetical protein NEICINOT_04388 [Neisseria cinerea ATCC 14685]|uniref:Uncharacterized protein n=1 Tax=Neisseria cinerea ATCC 14685 TaxID=546262 RepID=D0W3Z7_NEICI|nr:hypothetical protein NEICINOT_04388 [Neisseria cinerea ATCC 14685]
MCIDINGNNHLIISTQLNTLYYNKLLPKSGKTGCDKITFFRKTCPQSS